MKCWFTLLNLFACASVGARELSPDRPDTTESPITVEVGHFQIESSLWSLSRNKDAAGSVSIWVFGESNFKLGLTEDQDVQLVLRPWIETRVRAAGVESTAQGFGDAELRWKWNLWGNDGGTMALALMPFVAIPSQTAVSVGEWEGGVIVPVSITLGERFGLGFQLEVDRVWDDTSLDHRWQLLHSVVLGIDLTDSAGLYLEYIGVVSRGAYEAKGSAGLTWATGENFQWDVGVTWGLNAAAEDQSIFQGFTCRF
jgi:Putative MetA-pathway of phenol degradation